MKLLNTILEKIVTQSKEELPMKKGTYRVFNKLKKTEQRTGYLIGDFGISNTDDWVVSHLPTKLKIGESFKSKIQALKFVRILSSDPNWKSDDVEVLKPYFVFCCSVRDILMGGRMSDSQQERIQRQLEALLHEKEKPRSKKLSNKEIIAKIKAEKKS